ncbi:MAG: hypothetical protein ACOCUS_05430 [Polyangiales bacterium]
MAAAKQKAELARRAERDRLAALRAEYNRRIKRLREKRGRLLRRTTKACKRARSRVRARATAARAEARLRINQEAAAALDTVKTQCERRRARIRARARNETERARAERAEAKRLVRELSGVERARARKLAREEARLRRAERREESAAEVERNIDPELVPVWQAVKRRVHARQGISRTEAFLHWVEENQDEVWAILAAEAEREMRRLERERRRLDRAERTGKGLRKAAARAERDLEAVPF